MRRAKGERTDRSSGRVMEASVISVAAQLNLVDVACRKRAQHAPEASLPISSGWTRLSKFISPRATDRLILARVAWACATITRRARVNVGRKIVKKTRKIDEHPDQIISWRIKQHFTVYRSFSPSSPKIFSLSTTTEFAIITDMSREGYRTNPLVRLHIAILDTEKPDPILIEHNLTWTNLIRLDLIYVNLGYSFEYIHIENSINIQIDASI